MTNEVIDKINSLGDLFVDRVTKAVNSKLGVVGELDSYEIVWKQLQDIAALEIQRVLEENFKGCKVTIARSKSTYPDVKVEIEGKTFAIDVKSNESQKDPWFDMARLDTIFAEKIEKYDEEWGLVIKYDSETKKFLKAYFTLFREAVGIRGECNGVKYRPYDGKLRPKTWEDFEDSKVYWNSKHEFIEGIRYSQKTDGKL